MTVSYVPYGSVRVSRKWRTVLRAADRHGVRFHVTSGHRTLAEQWRLYRLYRAGIGNLAAFPSPFAPHIRTGRFDHALDVNALDGGEARLQRWLEKRGVRTSNPVAGEAWHLEVSARDLARLARRIRKNQRKIRKARRRRARRVARRRAGR